MANTDRFVKQHDELLTIAGQMTDLFNPDELTKDAKEVHYLLSTLAGKLKMHLAMEDEHLYPKLLTHGDQAVQETAERFIDEMGGIAEVFTAYMGKWATPTLIESSAREFIAETQGLFKALASRIDRENNELYVLVNKSSKVA